MTPETDLLKLCTKTLPWYELFFAMDTNEDGRLDYSEFVIGLGSLLGLASYGKLHQVVRALDVDSSGTIDWVEWVAVALFSSQEGHNMEPEPLRTAFRLLDRPSGDRALGAEDLSAIFSSSAPNGVLAKRAVQNMLGQWVRSHGERHIALAIDDVQSLLAAANESSGSPSVTPWGAGVSATIPWISC